MTGAERITYLVDICEGGNGRRFAELCDIPVASLSRARNGKAPAETYYARILNAYPMVNREWLYKGKGKPTTDSSVNLLGEVRSLRREVKRLAEIVEKLQKE